MNALISDAYRAEQERLHMDPEYGTASVSYAKMVESIINRLQVSQLLDYGCGKARLMRAINPGHAVKFQCYDPAIPGMAGTPIPMQMVTCIDVLEHVEPECLDNVLDDLVRVTEVIGFFTVCTEPAEKELADGRNAHLIQQPPEWWLPKFMERFELHTFQAVPNGFFVIVYRKKSEIIQ